MPVYNPNVKFSDCWSSVGNVTFYHRNGKCCWRKKSGLLFAGKPAQLEALGVHRRALSAWRSLAQEEQVMWNDLARSAKAHRPPFATPNHISGYNLFVSAYHGFHTLGHEHIPPPAKFRNFPDFFISFLSAERSGASGLKLRFSLDLAGADASEYALLGKIQLDRAGRGCNPGKMKNVLASDDGKGNLCFNVGDISKFTTVAANSYALHLRFLLIDRRTGYRSNFKSLSSAIDLT